MKLLKYILAINLMMFGALQAAAPAFGDLAVLLAKGYFGNYVRQDASLEQCVAFLSSQGIAFSLFDIMDENKKVTKEDCARVVGQSALLFSGEADAVNGMIKKPLEAETWVDYCLMNDIDLSPIWGKLNDRTVNGALPEVEKFFGR
jgi:hypothetical protein